MTRNLNNKKPDDGGIITRPGRLRAPLRRPQLIDPRPHIEELNARRVTGDPELGEVVGEMTQLLRRMIPKVLGTGLYALDSRGIATDQYRLPYACLSVISESANRLTVTSSPDVGAAPGKGPGIGRVPAQGFEVLNLAGNAWTIYGGNAGELVTVTAYAQPQPPASEIGIVQLGGASQPPPTSQYPAGAVPITADSGNQANATATATLAAAPGLRTWITGFEVTGSGATGALVVTVTVTITGGATLHYTYVFVAGATLANTPLIVEFPLALPTGAVNQTIAVSCPASGLGGTNNTVVAHGYQL